MILFVKSALFIFLLSGCCVCCHMFLCASNSFSCLFMSACCSCFHICHVCLLLICSYDSCLSAVPVFHISPACVFLFSHTCPLSMLLIVHTYPVCKLLMCSCFSWVHTCWIMFMFHISCMHAVGFFLFVMSACSWCFIRFSCLPALVCSCVSCLPAAPVVSCAHCLSMSFIFNVCPVGMLSVYYTYPLWQLLICSSVSFVHAAGIFICLLPVCYLGLDGFSCGHAFVFVPVLKLVFVPHVSCLSAVDRFQTSPVWLLLIVSLVLCLPDVDVFICFMSACCWCVPTPFHVCLLLVASCLSCLPAA